MVALSYPFAIQQVTAPSVVPEREDAGMNLSLVTCETVSLQKPVLVSNKPHQSLAETQNAERLQYARFSPVVTVSCWM